MCATAIRYLTRRVSELADSAAVHRVRGYFDEDRAFIDCVKSRRMPPNDLADAARTMQLAERLYHANL